MVFSKFKLHVLKILYLENREDFRNAITDIDENDALTGEKVSLCDDCEAKV